MSSHKFWCGFLDAGEKSSPVLLDKCIDTGNPETIYLFNLMRGEILEYKRAIITPKLRALAPTEQALDMALKNAYLEVRPHFSPRAEHQLPMASPKPVRRQAANDDDVTEVPMGMEPMSEFDDDLWLGEEA